MGFISDFFFEIFILFIGYSIVPFGEGNGNPLQCSCLENPMDGGTWWAAVCGIAKSGTRLSNTHTHTHTHLVFLATCSLSLVAVSRSYSSLTLHGLLTVVASLVMEHRP